MVAFRKDNADYQWALIHSDRGTLSLLRMDGVGSGTPQIMMTCKNSRQGGLQLRGVLANAGDISVSTPGARFAVDAAPREGFEVTVVQGEGRFPVGWFRALAAADVVTVTSGDTIFDAPGPRADAVGHYERYCRRLDQRRTS